ncbi:hypothetical protein D3C79_661490 [compost metagenome]
MAIDALTVNLFDVLTEELGDVFIGRPVNRHTQVVTVLFLEFGFEVRAIEPVGAKPVKVGELLVGQLIHLAVRRGGEGETDKVLQVQGRRGVVLALIGHQISNGLRLAITKVRTDQVRVVDPAVIDVLVRLHLRLQFFHHIAFLKQVVGQFYPSDFAERLGQYLGFIFVGGDCFRHHIDLHPTKRLRGFDEPLQFLKLLLWGQGRRLELTADPFLRRVFVGVGPGAGVEAAEHEQGGQGQMSPVLIVVEHRDLPIDFSHGA